MMQTYAMFGAGFAKLFDLARVKKRHVMMASLVLGASGTSFVVGASGQRTNIKECGGCTFWLEGTLWVNATLSKTGSCAETCTKLDLGEKGIVNIANGTFDDLPNVEKLGLYPNAITSIPVDAFKFLPAVVVIDLDTNRLKRVPPDAFKYNTKLETIWLNNNDITMLPADIFQYNPKLQYLFLDGNNIANLPADIFKNNTELAHLNLGGNNIANLPADIFKNNTKLEWLEISGNPLGCVYGVPDSVYFLDSYGYDYGYEDEEKTPECPANCTVNTYYDADALVCFACPDGTFTDGVGAVNCTAGAVTSPVATTQTTTATPVTTPSPVTPPGPFSLPDRAAALRLRGREQKGDQKSRKEHTESYSAAAVPTHARARGQAGHHPCTVMKFATHFHEVHHTLKTVPHYHTAEGSLTLPRQPQHSPGSRSRGYFRPHIEV